MNKGFKLFIAILALSCADGVASSANAPRTKTTRQTKAASHSSERTTNTQPSSTQKSSLSKNDKTTAQLIYVGTGLILANAMGAMNKDYSIPFINSTEWALSFSSPVQLEDSWQFYPQLIFTPLSRKTEDDALGIRTFSFQVPVVYQYDRYHFKAGAGFLLQHNSALGGSVDLPNGISTQTFYKPEKSSFIFLWSLIFGVGLDIDTNIRTDLDLVLTGVLSTKRAAGILWTASWGFEI